MNNHQQQQRELEVEVTELEHEMEISETERESSELTLTVTVTATADSSGVDGSSMIFNSSSAEETTDTTATLFPQDQEIYKEQFTKEPTTGGESTTTTTTSLFYSGYATSIATKPLYLSKEIHAHEEDSGVTGVDAIVSYRHLSASSSSETNLHQKVGNDRNEIPPASPTRQKFRAFTLMILMLAAVVPLIMLVHYIDPPRQSNHGQSMKSPPLVRGQIKRAMELNSTQYEDENVPMKRYNFLGPSSSKLIKFRPYTNRGSSGYLRRWDILTSDLTEVIKLDGMTVLLSSAVVKKEVHDRDQDGSFKNNNQEMSTIPENTSSSDEKKLLSSSAETAVWDPDQECVPMEEWQTTFNPSCNSVHEMDLPFLLKKDAYSLVSNKGSWRNAWNIDMKIAENGMSPVSNIVIKSLKYYHKPNDEAFETNRVDGVSIERLSHSRYVIDIYGYCGTSSLQEFAGAGSLDSFLRKLDPIGKLEYSAWIAAGIADIHEIDKKSDVSSASNGTGATASLIHSDINLDNILVGYRDGNRVPLINDFNIAILRKKDVSSGSPCRFRGLFFNAQWMAPEQIKYRDDGLSIAFLNEKIDVYALGNILHFIAVGQPPWNFQGRKRAKEIGLEYYEKKKLEWKLNMTMSKLKGVEPKIPHEVKNSNDPSIQAVLHAMHRCYRSDPNVRPSAREIADYLNAKYLELSQSNVN